MNEANTMADILGPGAFPADPKCPPRIIHNGDHAQFEIDNAHLKPEDRPDWPLPSFDARDWAKAFCKIAGEKGHLIDEGWMVSWFANALMRGFDEGRSRPVDER